LFKYSGAFTFKSLLKHWLVFTLHLPAKNAFALRVSTSRGLLRAAAA